MIRRAGILLVLTWLSAAACTQNAETTGLPQERFIEVMVALRRATQGEMSGDSAAFAARKQQILTEAGVTEEQLRRYVEAHARDLDHMAAVWESINVRLASPDVREPQ